MAVPRPGGHHSSMLRALEMPTVAAVNGATVGAGLGFVVQCDVRIASSSAFFLDGHLPHGIVPSVSLWYLPLLIGPSAALQMFCRSDRMDAAAARACGLVSEVVAPGELLAFLGT